MKANNLTHAYMVTALQSVQAAGSQDCLNLAVQAVFGKRMRSMTSGLTEDGAGYRAFLFPVSRVTVLLVSSFIIFFFRCGLQFGSRVFVM